MNDPSAKFLKPAKIDYVTYILLPVLVVAAVFLRLHFLQPIVRMAQDEALYAWYADRIHDSMGLIFSKELMEYHPPLFSILLQPGHWIFPAELGYRLINIVINTLGIVAAFFLGDRMGGRFLGFFAAAYLAFAPLYLEFASIINTDIPLTVFLIFFILAIASSSPGNNTVLDVTVGLLGAACIGIKWAGLIVIPILVLYALFSLPGTYSQRLTMVGLPLGIIMLFLSATVFMNYFYFHSLLPPTTSHTFWDGAYYKKSLWNFLTSLPGNIFSLIFLLTLFFCYGLIMLLFSRKKEDILLKLWFWVPFVGISLCQEKDARYFLLILPSSILISGRGMQLFLTRICPPQSVVIRICQVIFIVLFLLVWMLDSSRINKNISDGIHRFSGLGEAGQWIKEQAASDTVIIAASIRQIRYYSGIELADWGGQIHFPPEQRDAFEKWMHQIPGKVILVVDRWETTQPMWLNPGDSKNYEFLKTLGFETVKVVRSPVINNAPAVWLLVRDKVM